MRLNRRRFWDGDPAAFATLRHCLVEVAKLIAPFTPFIADEIHANLTGAADSVHLADFPEPDAGLADGELEAGVEAALRAIELGRAARAQAKIKNRQPLRSAVIVATDDERAEIERLGELVRAELNVKELEFVSEEGELVGYSVRPNYRRLGPRFGKQMPQVTAAVEALDAGHVAEAIRGERRIGINLDGREHALEPEDFGLVMKPLEGYEVEAEAGRAVALELELDDDLRREGLAREIVHAVQNARKQAGLDISDRISLRLGGDARLLEAARAHQRLPRRRDPGDLAHLRDGAGDLAPRSRGASCGSRSSASPRAAERIRPGPARARPRAVASAARRRSASPRRRRGTGSASGSRAPRSGRRSAGCRRR